MIHLSLDSINEQDGYYVMLSPKGGYIQGKILLDFE